jgi:transposase
MTTADALPEDVPGLRAAVQALIAERDALLSRIERMQLIIRQLQRAQFGRHSERLDPDQLQLALEEREIVRAHIRAAAEKSEARRRPRSELGTRKSLPAHLPRIEVVIEPETTSCPCCGKTMHVIGEERSERVDVIPAQHRILLTRRPKYGCRACSGAVVQAPAPERLIRAGLPTEAMVAHVLVSKYAWHLPLYRQAQILLAQGLEIDRSTLAFWVGYAAAELMPLWRLLREILLGSPRLFVDETRAPVLDPGRGRTKTGYFWSIARDDSAWQGDTGLPAVAYTYAPGRGAEHAMNLLAGYCGIVQCDGYAAYKQVAHRGRTGNAVILAFCWSHWRRRFYEITRAGSAPIATAALCSASRGSIRSRRKSAAAAPPIGERCAKRKANRWSPS